MVAVFYELGDLLRGTRIGLQGGNQCRFESGKVELAGQKTTQRCLEIIHWRHCLARIFHQGLLQASLPFALRASLRWLSPNHENKPRQSLLNHTLEIDCYHGHVIPRTSLQRQLHQLLA